MTPQQKIALQERKIWLASHSAPTGLSLISEEEMQTILGGIAKEARGRIIAQNALAMSSRYIDEFSKVADAAERAVKEMDGLILSGGDPMGASDLVSLRCSIANLRKFMQEHRLTPPAAEARPASSTPVVPPDNVTAFPPIV